MPELPEVETTAGILNKVLPGLRISDVWSDYNSPFHSGKENIKNPAYFSKFKKAVTGKKILGSERRGKNVLINLEGEITILVHMKMTGHLLYGIYSKEHKAQETKHKQNTGQQNTKKEKWVAVEPEELKDPFNRFIHLVFSLSNGKHLAFSDMRKFAKVFCFSTKEKNSVEDLKKLGPEPLQKNFSYKIFLERLKQKPNRPIKEVLMNQEIISGIGNIYSDEILWLAGVHPKSPVKNLPEKILRKIFSGVRSVLKKGIKMGGDSMSDYRNPYGKKGRFQNCHKAYRQTGKKCSHKGCTGTIHRLKIGGRNAHFCYKHQNVY